MHASELTTMRGNGVEDHADTGILRALWAGARGQAGGAGGGRGVASESLARAVERYVAVAQVGQSHHHWPHCRCPHTLTVQR